MCYTIRQATATVRTKSFQEIHLNLKQKADYKISLFLFSFFFSALTKTLSFVDIIFPFLICSKLYVHILVPDLSCQFLEALKIASQFDESDQSEKRTEKRGNGKDCYAVETPTISVQTVQTSPNGCLSLLLLLLLPPKVTTKRQMEIRRGRRRCTD